MPFLFLFSYKNIWSERRSLFLWQSSATRVKNPFDPDAWKNAALENIHEIKWPRERCRDPQVGWKAYLRRVNGEPARAAGRRARRGSTTEWTELQFTTRAWRLLRRQGKRPSASTYRSTLLIDLPSRTHRSRPPNTMPRPPTAQLAKMCGDFNYSSFIILDDADATIDVHVTLIHFHQVDPVRMRLQHFLS